jgi:hypothetical protein
MMNDVLWDRQTNILALKTGTESVSFRLTLFLARVISSILKIDETRSSETSVYNKPTRRHIPEDGIAHSHRSESLKSTIKCV